MRFVLSFGIGLLFSTASIAVPWETVPLANESKVQAPRPVQMQRGGASNTLQTLPDLTLEIAATGLGNISAIALGEDGTLYTADAKTGRLWALTDRSLDGKIDLRRPLPATFDTPTGLAVDGNTLYIADKHAVWVSKGGQAPRVLASLANAASAGGPHILLTEADSPYLTLGLSTLNQNFRILEIDKKTGQASLKADGNGGQLHSLARRSGSEIWAAAGPQLGPLGAKAIRFPAGQSIAALAVPGQHEVPRDWPAPLRDHIIAAHLGPHAMQLIAIPTEFGQVSGTPRSLAQGFLTSSARSAWGQPGAIVMDKRGLFFADPYNGTLWRLSPKPKPQAKITIVNTADLPPRPSGEPTLIAKDKSMRIESSIKGTQIDAKSTILQPSSIIYGSKLIKDFDEKKAAEDAAKDEETPKKKRRMSRKRQQKEK